MSDRAIICVDDFYDDPDAVRQWALQQRFYLPYQQEGVGVKPLWMSSWYRPAATCPFKSSNTLISQLEAITGEVIDRTHWDATYPVTEFSKPIVPHPDGNSTCLWNCSVHVKFDNRQTLGAGVHNHVVDKWNCVGEDGWAGLLYLNPHAPLDGGLHLWENRDVKNQYDWMTPPENWRLLDRFANLYNRLILVRGRMPHSGANGWGTGIQDGRMFQTFFFRTSGVKNFSVNLPLFT